MRLSSRQAIGVLLLSIFASGCVDAPTRPEVSPGAPSEQAAPDGSTVRTFTAPDGLVHEFRTKKLNDGTVHVSWRVDGKLTMNTISHLAPDGSVTRITGKLHHADGRFINIDQRLENGKPVGEISTQSMDPYSDWLRCSFMIAALAAMAAAIAGAAGASPVSWVLMAELVAAYLWMWNEYVAACTSL